MEPAGEPAMSTTDNQPPSDMPWWWGVGLCSIPFKLCLPCPCSFCGHTRIPARFITVLWHVLFACETCNQRSLEDLMNTLGEDGTPLD